MTRLIELEKQRDIGEIAGTFLENKDTEEVRDRINPYKLKFDGKGEPEFKYEKETELGKAEYEGLKNIHNLAELGYKYVFWLSPEGGRSPYDQGRISIGIVRNNDEIECRGIPILVTADEMYKMGREIIDYGGRSIKEIERSEDLREQAIGIDLKSEKDLWNFCQSIFGMEKVWKTIANGDDLRKKSETVGIVNDVLIKIRGCYGDFTSRNSIELGAILEREMEIRGYKMAAGNHGGLNGDLMRDTGFNKLFSNSEISVNPEVRDGKKYCPCGAEIKDGVSTCPKCGLKMTSGE